MAGAGRLRRRALLRGATGLLATSTAGLLAACAGPDPERAAAGARTVRAAEVLVLHHAQGLTQGVLALARTLQQAGHVVHTPDLYLGRTFQTLDDGLAYARQLGLDELTARGVRSADRLPADLVYLGFSLGVLPAQELAQTRAGARGAVLLEACAPPSEFGSSWPVGVPVQVHGMSGDPHFAGEGDLAAARELVGQARDGALYLYPGDHHLFTDSSLPGYDAAAARLVTARVTAFLASH